MTKRLYLIAICLLSFIVMVSAQKVVLTGVVKELKPEQRALANLRAFVWGRPLAMTEITTDKTFRLEADLASAGFYELHIVDQAYTVYLNPGDELHFEADGEALKVSGKGWIAENQLLQDNKKYQDEFFSLPIPVRTSFCPERAEGAWKAYQAKIEALDKATLRPEFKEEYKGFAGMEYWLVMIGGLGAQKGDDISPDYYKAVERVKLTENMQAYEQWYNVLEPWLVYNMNKKNIHLTRYENWLKEIASFIPDKGLREAFLVEQIRLEVLRGEFVALPEVVKNVERMITKPENQAMVKEQLALMEKKYTQYANCLPGADLTGFEFADRDGKTVKLADLKGKYVYIDVWSTGCMPCRKEIPYLEELQETMAGQNIVFVSISLDLKKEVWLKFIEEKNMGGLQWLAEKGFKHPFCAALGMIGIPQFILLDQEGKVINFNAKRPSNPILWKYLKDIVKS